VNRIFFKIDNAEFWLKQLAHEHIGRDNKQPSLILPPQQFAHVQLGIEDFLRTAATYYIKIDAELPWEVPGNSRFQAARANFIDMSIPAA
jgi:hypothetical protein